MIQQQTLDLINQARQLLTSPTYQQTEALKQALYAVIINRDNLPKLLDGIQLSKQFMFVFCEILQRAIINQQYIQIHRIYEQKIPFIVQQSPNNLSLQIQRIKDNTYGLILKKFNMILKKNDLAPQLINPALNLASLALMGIIEADENRNNFQQFLHLYFPGFLIDQNFIANYSSEYTIIQPQKIPFPQMYVNSMKILTSLLDHIILTPFSNYYDYRKTIYSFRSNFLGVVMQISINFIKLLKRELDINLREDILEYIKYPLQLLDQIMSYPYSLSVHDYESENEMNDMKAGEIYFPNFFRNIVNDQILFDNLYKLYKIFLMISNKKQIKKEVFILLRIFVRFSKANYYFFDNQEVRHKFRQIMIKICIQLQRECIHYQTYFVTLHLQFIHTIFNSYSINDHQNIYIDFIRMVLNFGALIIENCDMELQQQQKSPITQYFEILKMLYLDSKSKLIAETLKIDSNQLNLQIQTLITKLLDLFFNRIIAQDQCRKLINTSFKDYQSEVKTYSNFFKHIPGIFSIHIKNNLNKIYQLPIQNLSPSSQIVWIHLLSTLLAEQSAQLDTEEITSFKAQCVVKIFSFVKDRNNISDIRYLQVMANKIFQIDSEELSSPLAKQIEKISNSKIDQIIVFFISKCLQNLQIKQQNLIQYSLDILNYLYSRLKLYSVQTFKSYSKYLEKIFINLDQTIFEQPIFYKKRVKLFQMFALIWFQQHDHNPIYSIYNIVRKPLLLQPQMNHILKYMYDITGLTRFIEVRSAYKIILELFLIDFPIIYDNYFKQEKCRIIFKQDIVFKAFVKMGIALLTDNHRRLGYQMNSQIPVLLQHNFYPILVECRNFAYGKNLIILFNKFLALPSIKKAVPLPKKENYYKSTTFQRSTLIGNYFDQIYRVEDLYELFQQIKDNIDYLYIWFQEAVARKLDLTKTNFESIIASKMWKTRKEQQTMGKLLFKVGNYNQRYKLIPQLFEQKQEQKFVKNFIKYFK